MADENGEGGGGFGWGFVFGGLIGLVAGAYLASGPGREQVEGLRSRTIELTGRGDEIRARARAAAGRARGAVNNPESPLRKAVQDGVTAARRRRTELDTEPAAPPVTPEEAPGS